MPKKPNNVRYGMVSDKEEVGIRVFLNRFTVLPVDNEVAEKAVQLRRRYRIRLSDAIIWATAPCASSLLVARNTRDFPAEHPGVRVPYRL